MNEHFISGFFEGVRVHRQVDGPVGEKPIVLAVKGNPGLLSLDTDKRKVGL